MCLKCYNRPNWSDEVFVINIVKNLIKYKTLTVNNYWSFFLNSKQNAHRIEKVIQKKVDKIIVKWKGHNNSLNSWINANNVIW